MCGFIVSRVVGLFMCYVVSIQMVCYYLFAHVCVMARTIFSFPSNLIGLSACVLNLMRNISTNVTKMYMS